jgi:hypothetical protein
VLVAVAVKMTVTAVLAAVLEDTVLLLLESLLAAVLVQKQL